MAFLRYEIGVSWSYTYERMKKHRNFFIFYSFWLGAIILLLTNFDTPNSQNIEITNDSSSVCSLNKDVTNYAKPTKSQPNWCCDSKPQNSASDKVNRKDGLDKI